MKISASLFVTFILLFACQVWAQTPVVSKAVAYAISEPATSFGIARPEPGKITTRTMITGDESINSTNSKIIKEIIPGLGGKSSLMDMQRFSSPQQNIAAPITSFEGNSSQDNFDAYGGRVYPPDVNGDVSANHYVQTTNLMVGIYNKSTGALAVPKFKMSTLFTALGPPFSTTDAGDPIVLYDQLADRWLISQFLFTSSTSGVYYQVIAISKTGDPTGQYHLYAFRMPNNKLNDYPHFGVWPDGYYMADNQFTLGSTWGGAGAFAFDRAKMLVGDPSASFIYFDQFASCPSCGGQLPTDLDGLTPPPPGTPNLFMEFRADEYGDPYDGLRVFAFHADFATPANSTFTQVGTDLPLAAFDARNPGGRRDIEQPLPATSAMSLDALSDRLMHRLAYRVLPGGNQSIVGNFTVNVSGVNPTSAATFQAGIKWFELRRSAGGVMSVNNEGIYAPGAGDGANGRNIWMAAIAQDGAGNIGLGFSASSTSLFPSILYTGRLATDPPGMMSQGENTLVAGTGVQRGTDNRWGDYSSMSIDPDECTFWYTQEYYTAASQASSVAGWLTRIGSFKVNPTCVSCTLPVVTTPTVTQPTCVNNTGTIVVNATGAGTLAYSVNNGLNYQASNTFNALVPGTYNIIVKVEGVEDCNTAYDGNPVVLVDKVPISCSITSIPSDPVYTGGIPTNLYLGYGAQSTTLAVSATGDGPFTYSWTGTGLSSYNTSNPVFTPTSEGSFSFTVEVTNVSGCKNTCSITICVLDIRELDKKGRLSGKVFICHAPPMTPTNTKTVAVNPNAVPEHLMDHPGDRLGKCTDVICGSNLPFTNLSADENQNQTDGFSVKVSPNPSSSDFSIQVMSNSNKPVTIRILDEGGVVRSTSSNIVKGSVFRIGSVLKNGIYFAEIIQGENRRIVKLIKAK